MHLLLLTVNVVAQCLEVLVAFRADMVAVREVARLLGLVGDVVTGQHS